MVAVKFDVCRVLVVAFVMCGPVFNFDNTLLTGINRCGKPLFLDVD
jgi:hypothetical protein